MTTVTLTGEIEHLEHFTWFLSNTHTHTETGSHLSLFLNWSHFEACCFLVTPELINSQPECPLYWKAVSRKEICWCQQSSAGVLEQITHPSISLLLGGMFGAKRSLLEVRSIHRNSNLPWRLLKQSMLPTGPVVLPLPHSQSGLPLALSGTKLQIRHPPCHLSHPTFNPSSNLMILLLKSLLLPFPPS